MGWRLGERDEDQPLTDLDMRGVQAEPALIDIILHAIATHEIAAQRERPLVVGADDGARMARRLLAEEGAAMGADVMEGADTSLVVAHHDQRIGIEREGEVVPRLRDLAGIAGEDPAAAPDPVQLMLVEGGVVVEGARQPVALAPRGHKLLYVPNGG